jgi:DNA-binding transcriptional LysR family regulator
MVDIDVVNPNGCLTHEHLTGFRAAQLDLLPMHYVGAAGAVNSNRLNEVINQACRQIGFIPSVACRSGQWDFIVAMVENGMGIAILPEPYGVHVDRNRFVSMPF